ncbi:hypothetical protein EDB85DRAFT_2146266 [Lactarius pseudohatsudake]|nr:hypothetical protein EDB85DRAFT_2146266 [Lactarius pseudohatsudake]
MPSPVDSVGNQALHPSPPSRVRRTAFLHRLRDTPQPEEPAQTPNVAAVPTESRGTTDSESASVSDEQRVPEAAPVLRRDCISHMSRGI